MHDQSPIGKSIPDITHQSISKGSIGIERESLRLDGRKISSKNHPKSLGSPLFNSFITTDFSESQIEMISPPSINDSFLINTLENIHQYTSANIGDELLWPFSIPPSSLTNKDVEIAFYGNSNLARFKSLYRKGLSKRYGKIMQTISGTHFNYSLPEKFWGEKFLDKKSEKRNRNLVYFRTLRNIRRTNWIILFLFGCSPVIGQNLVDKSMKNFNFLNKDDLFLPFATSLRMSDIGYKNAGQINLNISYDGIDEYVQSLRKATNTQSEEFSKLINKSGEAVQISGNLLQIEDEYYAACRPKSNSKKNIRPTSMLRAGGTNYIELRSLDVNPFCNIGIDEDALNFLECFMIYCTISPSNNLKQSEIRQIEKNDLLVSREGRKPGLQLIKNDCLISLFDWGSEILKDMAQIAQILDSEDNKYSKSIQKYYSQLKDPEKTISSRLLEDLMLRNITLDELGFEISNKYKDGYVQDGAINKILLDRLKYETNESLVKQKKLESENEKPFSEFLDEYVES